MARGGELLLYTPCEGAIFCNEQSFAAIDNRRVLCDSLKAVRGIWEFRLLFGSFPVEFT